VNAYAVTCTTKDPYPSRRAALRVLASMRSWWDWQGRRRDPVQVYRCGCCGGWHLGRADRFRRLEGRT
jgi:hypothetical protein